MRRWSDRRWWRCGGEPIPCAVLDPFSGAGTTGLVARALGRRYVGIELNAEYIDITRTRLAKESVHKLDVPQDDAPLFQEAAND